MTCLSGDVLITAPAVLGCVVKAKKSQDPHVGLSMQQWDYITFTYHIVHFTVATYLHLKKTITQVPVIGLRLLIYPSEESSYMATIQCLFL